MKLTGIKSYVNELSLTYFVSNLRGAVHSPSTDIYKLGVLEDEFIEEIIYQWLEETGQGSKLVRGSKDTAQLVKLVGGYPLAAKRISTLLRVKSLEQLLSTTHREHFQLGFAEHILRTTRTLLGDLHHLILQILAIVQEPITQSDMLAIKKLADNYKLEEIHQARWELTDWFLLEQTGELMSLHSFLVTYYTQKLKNDSELRESIASDFGLYTFHRAQELNAYLAEKRESLNQEKIIEVSNSIFRYSTIADRLLRSVRKEQLAEQLPIRVKGTLREMVYYFYQELEDYPKALEYAEKWLKFNPHDSDIMLYKIRCYRKKGQPDALLQAQQLISDIETKGHLRQFIVRLLREKALIAQAQGDNELAKSLFREAIRNDLNDPPYSEIYADLARLFIREADNLPEWNPKKRMLANEAVKLLQIAQKVPDIFHRFHLSLYVEALILADKKELALPMLEDALQDRPNDGKLNFRMAEIKRHEGEFEDAKQYAEIAYQNGYVASLLTMANIFYDEAIQILSQGKEKDGHKKLKQTLEKISIYQEVHGQTRTAHDMEVADTIKSKAYRALNRLDEAEKVMQQYAKTNDPYTVYEHSMVYVDRADKALTKSSYADALAAIEEARECVTDYKFDRPLKLQTLFESILDKETKIRDSLGI